MTRTRTNAMKTSACWIVALALALATCWPTMAFAADAQGGTGTSASVLSLGSGQSSAVQPAVPSTAAAAKAIAGGKSFATAKAISLNTVYADKLAHDDDEDWFKVNVPSAGTLSITFESTHYAAGTAKARNYYEMSLENSRKQDIAEKDVIVGTSAASAAKTVMSAKVSAGWYYIEVEDGERFTNKTYTIKATFAAATTATSTKPAPATTPQNASASKWSRLAGSGALDTMRKIVQAGWANNSGGTVVIATKGGHYDALSAAGVAGVERAPILLTDKNTLSSQTRAELVRIKPRKVIIVGGTGAISAAVANQIKAATGVTPKRIFGATASDTANALNMAYEDKWRGETAFLVTQKSYHDALSIAPIAYAKKMPIFLAKDANTIDHATLRAMDECDIDNVIIVGGPVAVSKKVENILRANDMSVKRLAGSNAYTTSKAVAQWGVTQGLSANKMGVATTNGYHDAVCGAALCGKSASVLVLADDKNSANSSVAKTYKSKIARGYVFGGELAVGKKTYDAFNAATR